MLQVVWLFAWLVTADISIAASPTSSTEDLDRNVNGIEMSECTHFGCIMQRLQVLENGMQEKDHQIENLENGMKEKDHQIENLENGMKEKDHQITNLKSNILFLNNKLKELKFHQNKKEYRLDNIEMRQQNFEDALTENAKQIHKQSNFISFLAYATEHRNYNPDDVVLFDGIISNYGDLYDSSTSTFTCAYSGYYLFSVSILADYERTMACDIRIDGERVVSTYASDHSTFGHSSATVVILCNTAQQVWVASLFDGGRMYGNNYRYSSFTGTLLQLS